MVTHHKPRVREGKGEKNKNTHWPKRHSRKKIKKQKNKKTEETTDG